MTTMWFIVVVICLVSVTAAPSGDQIKTENKRDSRRRCITDWGLFAHGQVVNTQESGCVRYRCEFGNMKLLQEACPLDGSCHPIGSVWKSRDCNTYTCQKLGYHRLHMPILVAGCIDAYGYCRNEGDVFDALYEGRIYRDCTCTTINNNVNLECPPTRNWRGQQL